MTARFDRIKAESLVKDMVALIGNYFPGVALDWLKINRPDVHSYLMDSLLAVDAAILAEDLELFSKTLNTCAQSHRKAFDIYEQRPPLIDMQAPFHVEAAGCRSSSAPPRPHGL